MNLNHAKRGMSELKKAPVRSSKNRPVLRWLATTAVVTVVTRLDDAMRTPEISK